MSALRRHALANSSVFAAVDGYAAAGSNLCSLNRSPCTIMAQAMRAILLARATAATLVGRRPSGEQATAVLCRAVAHSE